MSSIGSGSGYTFQPYEGAGYKERDKPQHNKQDGMAGDDAEVLDLKTGLWRPTVAAGEGQYAFSEEAIDQEIPYDPTGRYGHPIDEEILYDPSGNYGQVPGGEDAGNIFGGEGRDILYSASRSNDHSADKEGTPVSQDGRRTYLTSYL